ncbi:MAG: glycosyl transferase family 2 [Thermoleophilia bacterium]
MALVAAGAASLAAWAALFCSRLPAWHPRPDEEGDPSFSPSAPWPSVAVLVPARNEAALLPCTLPSLLAQDYPGRWRVVLVDDRSSDGTGEVARAIDHPRLTVLAGSPLPVGWAGKVWALEQARRATGMDYDYLLLTDADIRHQPRSLRALVRESEQAGLALNSRMARLRCRSLAERLLIPAFLYFFFLLYPPRLVNDPGRRAAAAAGGCVLVRRQALDQAGGFAAIRDRVIDDVGLARAVKGCGGRIHLTLSQGEVTSLRAHDLASAWRMVRRTAFEQLRFSWMLVAGTLAGLGLLFLLPPAEVGLALATEDGQAAASLGALGGLAWIASAASFRPAVRYFGLGPGWCLALPLAAALYAGMTVDSALRGSLGKGAW